MFQQEMHPPAWLEGYDVRSTPHNQLPATLHAAVMEEESDWS